MIAACNDGGRSIHEIPADGEELPILRQVSRAHSHEQRAMQLVIRDAASLARIPLEDIDVDFNREMLLIVTLGSVPSDQYRIQITRVYRKGSLLFVDSQVDAPPPGSPIAPAGPYCIAVVPRSDLNVANFLPSPPRRDRTWTQSEPAWTGK